MSCARCKSARDAVRSAGAAILRGDTKAAAASAKIARSELAAKARDEAERVRALIKRK